MEEHQRLHPSRSASPPQVSAGYPMSEYTPYVAARTHDYESITYLDGVGNEGFVLSDPSSVLRSSLDARHALADVRYCCPPYSTSGRRPW